MARKKDERVVKQAYKDERKAKESQKKAATTTNGGGGKANEPYLQANDDHFVSFKNQLATMGLMLRDIPGDGNCLFRALNDQMEGHSRNHLQYRQDTVRFMEENRADYEPFVEDDVPFKRHVDLLSKPGVYGGQDALVAFARMKKVNIVIHQLNMPLWQIEGGTNGQLHLSYHNGEHYSSVRTIGDSREAPANIKINMASDAVAGTSASSTGGESNHRKKRFDWDEVYDETPNSDDVVQRISERTGCTDQSMIFEALTDHNGDENLAADFIASLMMATAADSGDGYGYGDEEDLAMENLAAASSTMASSSINGNADPRLQSMSRGELNHGGGGGKPKIAPAKKLTNKQRKEQNRRERLNRQGKPDDGKKEDRAVASNNDGDQNDLTVVEASIGCLRI